MGAPAEEMVQDAPPAFRTRATGALAPPDLAARPAWFPPRAGLLAKHAALALSLAGLIFGRQAFALLHPPTAYYYQWQLQDGLAFLANMLLLAGVLLGLGLLRAVATRRTTILIFDLGFLLLLADGVLSCLCPPYFTWMKWYESFTGAVLFGLVILVLLIPPGSRARLIALAKVLTLTLFPVTIAIAAIIVGTPDWASKPRVPATQRPDPRPGQNHPVFLFVFDEWSFDRSTRDRTFLPSLQNIRALSEQSLVFTQAYSRSFLTEKSLPAILFQTDQDYVIGKHETFWQLGDVLTSTPRVPSLFQLARGCGYETALRGFYHPYHRVLENQIDDCVSHCHFDKGTNFLGRMAAMALWTPRTITDPITRRLGLFLDSPLHRRYWFEVNSRIQAEAEELIAHCSPNTFAAVHMACPHGPFVHDLDGGYLHINRLEQLRDYVGELRGVSSPAHTPARYAQSVQQVDRFVGRVVAALRAAGKYDDAMLIVTSDHSWRADPLPRTDRGQIPHVPLVIKMPRQTRTHVVDRPVVNYQIQALIEGVLKDGLDADRAVELIAAGRLPGPPG